jgi:hypothetical protein
MNHGSGLLTKFGLLNGTLLFATIVLISDSVARLAMATVKPVQYSAIHMEHDSVA